MNDNAPVFRGAPYIVNISEHSLVGSVIYSDILALDADQQGPFSSVEYYIKTGAFSDYLALDNPLEGKIILAKSLDYESLQSFQVTLIAQDQGSPPLSSETSITINILDADDQNPVYNYNRYDALLPEQAREDAELIISAFYRDLGIDSAVFYTFSGRGSDYMSILSWMPVLERYS